MNSAIEIQDYISKRKNLTILFGSDSCSPCQAIKPKLVNMLACKFPEISFLYIDVTKILDVAGYFGILSIPTVSIYIEGNLTSQFVKTFSIFEIEEKIKRPYQFLFPA